MSMNIVIIITSVLCNAFAQILMKKGIMEIGAVQLSNLRHSLMLVFFCPWIWGAMTCFILSLFLWLIVLSRVDVSYAFPFNSIGYVVVALLGHCLFNEQMNSYKIIGLIVICIGIVLLNQK